MSINRSYYVIAGFDLTDYKTDKYDDWRWTEDGERYTTYQRKGYLQLFDDPMCGVYLYFGYVLAAGDEYEFKTAKIDIAEVGATQYDLREAVRYFKEIGIIGDKFDEAGAYKLIMFEECT